MKDEYITIEGKVLRGFKIGKEVYLDTDLELDDENNLENETDRYFTIRVVPKKPSDKTFKVGQCAEASDEKGAPIPAFLISGAYYPIPHWISIEEVDGEVVIYDGLTVDACGDKEQTYFLPATDEGDVMVEQMIGAIGCKDVRTVDDWLMCES